MRIPRIGLALSPPTADAPHDIHFDATGNLVLAIDDVAVGQHARQRIMTFSREWFLDTTAGLPWLTEILGKRENLPLAEAIVKNEILDTDGVVSLTGFSARLDRDRRNLIIQNFSVATDYGIEVTV